MTAPRWKIWLSYLMELHVESVESEHNPHLYVSLKQGRYQLSTANAVYSFADLYSNFARAFELVDLDRLPGREVLVLGLGLGSIPYMLEKTFRRDYHYTAVELDEAVLYLASRYSLPQLRSGIELRQADALAFVEQGSACYDLICMDVFLDDYIPEPFEGQPFLQGLHDLLAPGGLLLYNRLAATTRDKRRSRRFYEQHFRVVFPEGALVDVGGNYMLVNRRDYLKG